MTKFYEIPVSNIERLTDDAVAISLEIPADLKQTFAFVPGQYLTLEIEISGKPERRSYSICSSLDQDELQIGVKKVEQGLVSSYLNDVLKVGDTLNIMPPDGRFTAPIDGTHNYMLLASGSGITPCLSIAKSVLENEPDSKITLVYGNRSIATMMFRDTLSILKDTYMKRLSIIYLLSREKQDVAMFNGRLESDKLSELINAGLLNVDEFDTTYLCGPQEMIEDISAQLQTSGMDKSKIKFELFGTTAAKPRRIENAIDDGFVDIILDGSQKRIAIDGGRQTVLSAAQSAGLDLPFSCAGGMCCTCRCKIIEGSVEMDTNYSLEDWEIEAGFTLACQARPKSKTVKLDFDAV